MKSHNEKSIVFTFVCQKGELELMATVLTCSLRKHVTFPFRICIGIPKPFDIFDQVQPDTIQFLESLDVDIFYFENELVLSRQKDCLKKNDFLLNKIYLLQQLQATEDKVIFIDTDYICIADFCTLPWIDISLLTADLGVHGARGLGNLHEEILTSCGCKIPLEKTFTLGNDRHDHIIHPRGMSTSFIAMDNSIRTSLTEEWIRCHSIVEKLDLPGPYFAEQGSLLPAALKNEISYTTINPCILNLYHYNNPKLISEKQNKHVLLEYQCIVNEYPFIQSLLKENSNWNEVIPQKLRWKKLL